MTASPPCPGGPRSRAHRPRERGEPARRRLPAPSSRSPISRSGARSPSATALWSGVTGSCRRKILPRRPPAPSSAARARCASASAARRPAARPRGPAFAANAGPSASARSRSPGLRSSAGSVESRRPTSGSATAHEDTRAAVATNWSLSDRAAYGCRRDPVGTVRGTRGADHARGEIAYVRRPPSKGDGRADRDGGRVERPRLCGSVASADAAANHVADVRVHASEGGGVEIEIVGTGAPTYNVRVADGGRRLLVDLANTDVAGAPAAITTPVGDRRRRADAGVRDRTSGT